MRSATCSRSITCRASSISSLLLPADNASSGFDNIADLLFVSPVVMERYVAAAQKLSRLAVGDLRTPVMVNIHKLSEQRPQDARVEELSFGTRGGLAVQSYFPLDAEYTFEIETARAASDRHEIELSLDGARAAVAPVGGGFVPRFSRQPDHVLFRVPVTAGPHLVGITFVEHSEALDEGLVRERMRSRGTLPAIAIATIRGPYSPTGPGDTPSRRRIFVCRPSNEADEAPCAREILSTLARRAYRRAATDADLADLHAVLRAGRAGRRLRRRHPARARAAAGEPAVPVPHRARAGRDDGRRARGLAERRSRRRPRGAIRRGCARGPAGERRHGRGAPRAADRCGRGQRRRARVAAVVLPLEQHPGRRAARHRRSPAGCTSPSVLRAQVDRMLADPRAESMVTNFAAQWLFLRDVEAKEPDIFLFPDHDMTLRRALERETELFVGSVLRGGGSVVDLLTARYTFLNERLAKHYGVPNVYGSYFRRVDLRRR